jgi:nitrogen fixation protein NifX
MPPINRQFDMVHSDEWSMKVAFASSDYRHVDQHFGATPRLVVYGVKADRVTLIRVVDFSGRERPPDGEDRQADPRP